MLLFESYVLSRNNILQPAFDTTVFMVWISLINLYPFGVVKYIYMVLNQLRQNCLLFASILFSFYHLILLETFNMQPYKNDAIFSK